MDIGSLQLLCLLKRALHRFEFSFEGDHLQLAAHNDFLKLLQVQDLLLQFALRLLEVADGAFVGTHVSKDANGADTRPSRSRRAEALSVVGITSPEALRGLRLAFRVTPRSTTSRRAAVNWRVFRADEAGDGLFNDLICAEAEELGDGVVGEGNLAFEVRDEHRVRRAFLMTLRVGPRFVEFAHVTEDADCADHLAFVVAKGGCVERGRDDFIGGAARVEEGNGAAERRAPTSRRAAVNSRVSSALMKRETDCSRRFVCAEAEELGDRVEFGEGDFAFEVRDEHGSGAFLMRLSA